MKKEKTTAQIHAHKRLSGKIISLLLSLAIVLTMSVIPVAAGGGDLRSVYYDNDFGYSLNPDGTVDVRSYIGNERKIVVPDKLGGKEVSGVGNMAFANLKDIESVELPEKISEINFGAFQGCTSLISFVIPQNVTSIGDSTFNGCTSLKSVMIPEGVKYISYAFRDCDSLESVTIPKSVISIAYNTFDDYYDKETGTYKKITIKGFTNSAAHHYAREYGFNFESLGNTSPLAYDEFKDGTINFFNYYGEDCDEIINFDIPTEIDGKLVTEI